MSISYTNQANLLESGLTVKLIRQQVDVIAAYPGRISERNKIANEEDSETTTT